ncbi:hypothetical protein LTS12_027524 [Elasticomyces elasticus]|nr:hypothetical protein LTS12_027524 [Elasticomyces elasticus]
MSHNIPSNQSSWPSKDLQEAYFMQYFIQELAQWFDTCDASGKHFARVVPGRATTCPALYYAILSASARHISRRQRLSDGDVLFSGKKLPIVGDEIALEYQGLCISRLVASYSSVDEVLLDEDLLTATVILRFYEEVDAPLAGIDNETYLRGTQILASAQAATAIEKEGLQRASFWVAFRQEFHKALLKQRAFSFNPDCCRSEAYGTLNTADDSTWANRMILHCADILGYCYGDGLHILDSYNALLEYNQAWQELAPSVFSPIFSKEPDRSRGEVFPELWYLDDCTGGDRVTDRLEQNALLDVLVRTEKIHALPTTDAQERLKYAWKIV